MLKLQNFHNNADIRPSDIWQARARIQPFVTRTPLISCNCSSELPSDDMSIYLKLENLQTTGSFKIRGATNAIMALSSAERKTGVTTFSTGNHGLAVAHVAKQVGSRAIICISNEVPSAKVEAIRRTGAELRVVGKSQDDAEEYCYRLSKQEGLTVIKPFDDPYVIAGQGTIALEIMEDLPHVDTVIVPLSGGGLISGIALGLKSSNPSIRVIGVSMEHGAAMYESIKAGTPTEITEYPTYADSLRGGIGLNNRYTFSLVQSLVDDIIRIPESGIKDGMRFMIKQHHMIIEGASATGIGAILSREIKKLGRKVVIIVSGSNVDDKYVQEIMTNPL